MPCFSFESVNTLDHLFPTVIDVAIQFRVAALFVLVHIGLPEVSLDYPLVLVVRADVDVMVLVIDEIFGLEGALLTLRAGVWEDRQDTTVNQ